MIKSTETFRPLSFDKILFFITLILSIGGAIMVFSASAIPAGEKYHSSFYFLIHQAAGIFLGFMLFFILIRVRKPLYENRYVIYGLLLLTAILLVACLAMPPIAKTNRWIQVLGMRFQPSELAKISLILYFAYYFDRKKEKIQGILTLLPPLAILFIFILLILKEPDFGTALLIFFIAVLMLFMAGVKLKHFLLLGAVSLGVFAFFLVQADYRINRIMAFLSPEKDPLGISFQMIQSKLALGSGGLLGVGFGESTQKLFYLPCAHTDFIFAIFGEELGLLGTLTVLTLFLVFFWRGLSISFKAPSSSSQLAAAGLTLMIICQALLNITIVLGLGPPKGVPLPFLSFGRSSLFCNFLAVGILLHISQRRRSSGVLR
jgi:cell division protein FtsW